MDNNTVTILNEEFENDKTGEKVQGITIIVDGKLKEVLDLLMKNNPDYKNYTEIVRDAFFDGINSMIRERFCTAGRAARHRRETPLCAYAKQLQKGDHKNGYF